MALVSSPSSLSSLHLASNRVDLRSIHALVSLVGRHVHLFLSDDAARKSLQRQCSTRLAATTHGYFEFSDHSVLSNLYWGVESLELAVQSGCGEERLRRLVDSERMLQVPALLEEDGTTAGIPNGYLVCCTYFYLSLVRKLRGDEWQMAMHFLQSVLVSPRCIRTDIAPGVVESVFGASRGGEEKADEVLRRRARKYKDWLMYYRVVSYEEGPPWGNGSLGADGTCNRGEQTYQDTNFGSSRCFKVTEQARIWLQNAKIVDPINTYYDMERQKTIASTSNSEEYENFTEKRDGKVLTYLDESFDADVKGSFDIRRLQEMLEESQSESPVSLYSHIDSAEASDSEARIHNTESPAKISSENADNIGDRTHTESCAPQALRNPMQVEAYEANASYLFSSRSHSSFNNLSFSILDFRDVEAQPFSKSYIEEGTPPRKSPTHGIRCFSSFSPKFLRKYSLHELVPRGSFARRRINYLNSEKDWSEESSNYEKDTHIELLRKFEKAVSTIYKGRGDQEDADLEVMTLWKLLNNKTEMKYSSVKQDMLDQLMDIISTSKQEKVVRASVSILLVLISEDTSIIDDIKRKNLNLYDLASALKKNVHEAAILIYLLNPSPSEIKSLELLPALVDVACNSNNLKECSLSLPVTPTSASIAMIEILVTAFDYVTNNVHLATISSPQILSKLVNIAMNRNLEEGITLAAILVRCMRLNGNCKKFLSQVTPVDPFLHLLRSNDKRAKFAALEYLHELLRMPRSSVICLLHQIQQQGSIAIMHTLMACIQQAELEHRLLAANLLLQLDMLEGSSGKSVFREEAIDVLLESVASEDNPTAQTLSASILSNLGGTYAWTGEPYTAAWLVKKAGLTSFYHKNMIRNIDWFDPCLQDAEIYAWSGKIAKGLIKSGNSVFTSLAKAIRSKTRSVQRDCLTTIAWLGSEMAAMGSSQLRYSACEILLSEVALFLHPGSDLDERVLACLSVYNYTSGKGKQKLMNFSEGLRESLRRLSSVTWIAEELLKVTDYFLPTKPRVSCVHTQTLEVSQLVSGAATALIFYKGQLCAGYSDGSIKVWDIKKQRSVLLWEVKEHKRPVTCFTLFEPGDSLLSGSTDKTIRVWKMIYEKLECVEVIDVKEPIQRVDAFGDKILAVTQSRGLKVCDASRSIRTVCKNKNIKSIVVAQGKIYLGCSDSSIQEVDIIEDNKTEIRAPVRSWRRQSKPINSILVYKGWVYCAGAIVEGSSMKEWRRNRQPQYSITLSRGANVQATTVVEDFIYLNCSSSPSIVQIWLRGKQQRVGRLSAGSKVTSILAANDTILCGTEAGLIKGWIPL